MLQIRSILDVADNTGARRAAAIGVLGRNQMYARVGDVIKAHIKEAAPDGTVKKGEVVDAVVVRTRQPIRRNDGCSRALPERTSRIWRRNFPPPRITCPCNRSHGLSSSPCRIACSVYCW